jgi:hypothetical protein
MLFLAWQKNCKAGRFKQNKVRQDAKKNCQADGGAGGFAKETSELPKRRIYGTK